MAQVHEALEKRRILYQNISQFENSGLILRLHIGISYIASLYSQDFIYEYHQGLGLSELEIIK